MQGLVCLKHTVLNMFETYQKRTRKGKRIKRAENLRQDKMLGKSMHTSSTSSVDGYFQLFNPW
jgi:hypothetical protein